MALPANQRCLAFSTRFRLRRDIQPSAGCLAQRGLGATGPGLTSFLRLPFLNRASRILSLARTGLRNSSAFARQRGWIRWKACLPLSWLLRCSNKRRSLADSIARSGQQLRFGKRQTYWRRKAVTRPARPRGKMPSGFSIGRVTNDLRHLV